MQAPDPDAGRQVQRMLWAIGEAHRRRRAGTIGAGRLAEAQAEGTTTAPAAAVSDEPTGAGGAPGPSSPPAEPAPGSARA